MAYDITSAFEDIELSLITSMRNNMRHHISEEYDEGINWTQWQAEMLSGLSQYRAQNKDVLTGYMGRLNDEIDKAIREAYATGESEQEIELLKAIKKGYEAPKDGTNMQGRFFRNNQKKLNSLIKATTKDMKKAETALLRMSDDVYRQTLFKAQLFYNTGAGSMWQCIDMATRDFLNAGYNCVQYKNGARVNIASYAEMALRTANKRANLMGQADFRERYGVHTVKVNARGTACPRCLPFLGQVFIDDVYGGGTYEESTQTGYPLLSSAVNSGLFHPNCKDACSSYYEGISREPKTVSKEQEEETLRRYKLEQEQRYYERNYRRNMRLAKGSMDSDTADKYYGKANICKNKLIELCDNNSDVLRLDKARISLRGVLSVDNIGRLSITPAANKNANMGHIMTLEDANNISTNAIISQYNHRINDLGVNLVPYNELGEKTKKLFGADFTGMDKRLAIPTSEQLSKLTSEYETMLIRVKVGELDIASSPAGTDIAMNIQQANMTFNKSLVKDYDDFMDRMKKAVERGHFPDIPESQYEKYVVTHEFTHTLLETEGSLKNYVDAETKHIAKARKEIKNIRNEYDEFIRDLTVRQKKAELEAITSFDEKAWKEAAKLTEELKANSISKYADMNADEFMAEAFADAKLSDNPSPYSIKVLNVIDKYFKKK